MTTDYQFIALCVVSFIGIAVLSLHAWLPSD